MAGRKVIYVGGKEQQSWTDAREMLPSDVLVVDVTEAIPHDPAGGYGRRKGKGKGKGKGSGPQMRTVDTVCRAEGFPQAVEAVLIATRQSNKTACLCNWGVHRSPVVAAAAREVLIEEGHSVIIVEISKLQKDYVREVIAVAEDWVSNRRGFCDMPASYNNFRLAELCQDPFALGNLTVCGIGQSAAGAIRASGASSVRQGPYAQQHLVQPPQAEPQQQPLPASSADRPQAVQQHPLLPPPPPPASPSSASEQGVAAPGLPPAWEQAAEWYVQQYSLDDDALKAMRELAAYSEREVEKALVKLTTKAQRGDEVRNPSAFVAIACRNALKKQQSK